MDESNPHGGGVAWVADGELNFRRGLNAKEIFALQQDTLSFPYLLHFRWATQGAKVPELTHPFPVGPRALFGELRGVAERVLIHNGTWHNQDAYIRQIDSLPWPMIETASDTAIAAWLMERVPELLDEVRWATAVGSVVAGALHVERTGTWTTFEGNLYSNLHWLPAKSWWTAGSVVDDAARKRTWGWALDREEAPKENIYRLPHAVTSGNWEDLTEEGWEQYLRAKYGSEFYDEVASDAEKEPAVDLDMPQDMVSDDAEVVNAFLAERMIG